MQEKARNVVRIVAMVCLAIMFGLRKDYPIAAILFIVAINELATLPDRRPKTGSIHYHTKAPKVDVAVGKSSVTPNAQPTLPGETEEARRFRQNQAKERLQSIEDKYTVIPIEMITTESQSSSTSTSRRYSYRSDGVQTVRDAFTSIGDARSIKPEAINPLPADPPAPDSPAG
jgi:hypothetical protein